MSDPFIGEIKLFAGNFAPVGWAMCNGQLLPIASNTGLFSMLGTYYGGNGKTNFALPDLIGRVPVQQGQGAGLSEYALGEQTGTADVTLLQTEMPMHGHDLVASTVTATQTGSAGQMLSEASTGGRVATTGNIYSGGTPGQIMAMTELTFNGGNQPHNNMMPYVALNYVIALLGVWPPRS